MIDPRLSDKAWRLRVGFDNIAKPLWTTPTMKLGGRWWEYLSAFGVMK